MDDERKRLLASLEAHPAWAELKAWTQEQRDAYLRKLADAIYEGRPLTEADLDYKRGFFRGMALLLNQPFFSAAQLRKEIERRDVTESA